MTVHVGGYGFQGLAALPYLDSLTGNGKLVVNGLAGYYAVLSRVAGREFALKTLSAFVERYFKTLSVMDSREDGEKLQMRLARVRHCRVWSRRASVFSSTERDNFLVGLRVGSKSVEHIWVEVFNLERGEVELVQGSLRELVALCISPLGLFPPLKDKYVTTTHLSQIPVSFLEDGDTVLLNLRDPTLNSVKSASDSVFQAMELRSLAYVRVKLEGCHFSRVEVTQRVRTKNVLEYLRALK